MSSRIRDAVGGIGRYVARVLSGVLGLLRRRRVRIAATAVVVMLLGGVGGVLIIDRLTGLPSDAALRVGETVITEDELDDRVRILGALYGIERPADDEERADEFMRDSAKAVAVSLILEGAAAEHDIHVSDKFARDTLSDMIESRMNGGRDEFVKLLSEKGVSEGDVLGQIKQQEQISQLAAKVTEDLPEISDKDVRAAYREREDKLVQRERRHLRNIVVEDKQRATQLFDNVKGAQHFAALAKRYSIDQTTRKKGGDIGVVIRDQLQDNYAKVAFDASEGAYFGPVETEHGWNIGQVVDIKPGRKLKYDEVEKYLRNALATERALALWRDWLAGRIADADVEYADDYRPDEPDAPPKLPAESEAAKPPDGEGGR